MELNKKDMPQEMNENSIYEIVWMCWEFAQEEDVDYREIVMCYLEQKGTSNA